jgi:hypothetical protein
MKKYRYRQACTLEGKTNSTPDGRLATIICDIDCKKNEGQAHLKKIIFWACDIVNQMQNLGLDTGKLSYLLLCLHKCDGNVTLVSELVDGLHQEITRLLGKDAELVYGDDEPDPEPSHLKKDLHLGWLVQL